MGLSYKVNELPTALREGEFAIYNGVIYVGDENNKPKSIESPILYGDLTNKQTEPHNALGALAIDMQLFRDAPTQVAAGNSSFALGASNTASGAYSVAMGFENIASAFSSVAMGEGNTASGESSLSMGGANTASAFSSVAIGRNNTASEYSSVAMGLQNTASGQSSVAMGGYNTANGNSSVAMGRDNTASGEFSVAMGNYNTAGGHFSVAMGETNTANGRYSTVIGGYSTNDGGDVDGTAPTDHLFKIGNGMNNYNRSNAYVLLRNGTPIYPSLPTTDPQIVGALWNNSGVVNVSAG